MGYDDTLATKQNIAHYIEEFKNLSDEELITHKTNNPTMSTGLAAAHLLNHRHSKLEQQRHRQILIVCILSAVAACIAAYPAWFPPQKSNSAVTAIPSTKIKEPISPSVPNLQQQQSDKKQNQSR